MSRPTEVLHKRLHPKPLADKEVVVYKLIESDHDDRSRIDIASGKHMKNVPTYSLAPKKNVYDPIAKKSVIISNVVSEAEDIVPGTNIVKKVPRVGRVVFTRGGTVTLTSAEQATYEFMERCDENIDNPFRNTKKPAVFYRVNPEKKILAKEEEQQLIAAAINWISTADQSQLKAVLQKMPDEKRKATTLDSPISQIKSTVWEYAVYDNPRAVLLASTDSKSIVKIQVMEAAARQIIMFTDGDGSNPRQWFFNETGTPTIIEVPIAKNKYDVLVDYLTSKDGAKTYKKDQ